MSVAAAPEAPGVAGAGPDLADRLAVGLFSVAGPAVACWGGGPFSLPSAWDAGTLLAVGACLGYAARPSPAGRVALVACAATWLSPDGRVASVGLTLATVLALLRPRLGIPRPLSTLWLAIAAHLLWAPLAFRLVGAWVVAAEMPLVRLAAALALPGAEVVGQRVATDSGWYVYVLEGCSAFAGASAVALVWYASARLARVRVDARLVAGLGVALLATVATNVARIVAMASGPAAYAFWHDGGGADVVVAAGVAFGALPVLVLGRR